MTISRRRFLGMSAAIVGAAGAAGEPVVAAVRHPQSSPPPGFDPWIEVKPDALRWNVGQIARLAGGRPILAVLKNNAYGLGLDTVGPILDPLDEVTGLAVVKADEALRLRSSGVRKPILLMGRAEDEALAELATHGIRLAPFGEDDPRRLAHLAGRLGRPVPVHLYLDTGMSRLGMSFRRAVRWINELDRVEALRIEGTFTALTEEDEFDDEQVDRLRHVAQEARSRGLALGALHAASSHALFHRPDALLDLVRPGLALYGAYPAGARELAKAELRPGVSLKARVVRVERLERGDTVSYGRRYTAERPTWIATVPVGHADGYPRAAVNGCEVLIGRRRYPVIGAVSASHTIVELGEQRTVEVGDEATLLGADDAAVHPNTVAQRAGVSVYDVLMHLSAGLPRILVS